jgi:biotin synthase-related radical SAM superfamily protein
VVEIQESPQFVQTSLAGAISLGLEGGRFSRQIKCTCLNLLLTYESGCRASCGYCGLARSRQADDISQTFIRVKWPIYTLNEILNRVKTRKHPFKRVCVSMVTHGQAMEDTCRIIDQVREHTDLPISGLLAPTVMKGKDDLRAIKSAGADRVGIAIDAATPELFERWRGQGVRGPHRWEHFWQMVADAVEVFGWHMVGVHLIVGLGETEEEMVQVISRAHDMGALTHLFSFFPEAGSLMEKHPQPDLGNYRRIQLARYLINEGIISARQMSFADDGRLTDFGTDIEPYMRQGLAFMTSGCPDRDGFVACNRPFGNERASEPMRNYPFIPESQDIELIRSQLWNGVRSDERY